MRKPFQKKNQTIVLSSTLASTPLSLMMEQMEYAANVIAENIYAQVHAEGRRYMPMDSIVDHRRDESPKDDEYIVVNGNRSCKQNTDGCQFDIQWKNGTTSWKPIKTLKEANPVEIMEYVISNKNASEPSLLGGYRSQSRNGI
jgi:hypothetical protein